MSILVGARIRVSWLKEQFKGPLLVDAIDKVVQQHARYHILVWLESILFMDKSADHRPGVGDAFTVPEPD